MNWRIYYDDGKTYSSEDGPVELAPAFGVIVILDRDVNIGWRLIVNCDYFVWDSRDGAYHWWESNIIGLIDYLSRPGWKKVLVGRLIENSTYDAIFQRAYKDRSELLERNKE